MGNLPNAKTLKLISKQKRLNKCENFIEEQENLIKELLLTESGNGRSFCSYKFFVPCYPEIWDSYKENAIPVIVKDLEEAGYKVTDYSYANLPRLDISWEEN